ncbi:MAG: GNAT family N-acetyltransferase [Lachnospiraceae bacterium]|nr:GNAT family N-acetyltransferase [Lachnospiraceae bacterium]
MNKKRIDVRPAVDADIDSITRIYEDVCDYLSEHQNYPGWIKGIYPTAADALQGLKENGLYVALIEEQIVGSFIFRHAPENGYEKAQWRTENDYSKIYVLYTVVVDPDHLRQGVGEALIDFAEKKAKEDRCCSIRLDVVKGNIPAENLYKKCGYQYIDTVSLGYEKYGLPWFDLFEKEISTE